MASPELSATEPDSRPRGGLMATLQWIFLIAVLGFGGYWVYSQREALAQAWETVSFWPILGAVVCGLIGAATAVPIWRTVLAGMGSPLVWSAATRIVLIGQLGKYVPGGIWSVVAQAKMAKEEDVPVVRSATASLMSLIISMVTSITLGAVALLFAKANVLAQWWWIPLLALPLLAILHPRVIQLFGTIAGKILRRPVALPTLDLATVLRAAGWSLGGQVFLSAQFYLLFGMVSGHWSDPLLPIGLFQLASSVGILVVIAAAGAGPRELILVAGTAAVIGQAPALLASLLSRAVMTVADFALAAIGAVVGRRRRRELALLPPVSKGPVTSADGASGSMPEARSPAEPRRTTEETGSWQP